MKTAELMMAEYLHLGYSFESLRSLVESVAEPERTELLAILDRLESAREAADVFCETVARDAAGIGGAPFFIAGDEDSAAGESIIDLAPVIAEYDQIATMATTEAHAEIPTPRIENAVPEPAAAPENDTRSVPDRDPAGSLPMIDVRHAITGRTEGAMPGEAAENTAPARPDGGISRRERRRQAREKRKQARIAVNPDRTETMSAMSEIVLSRTDNGYSVSRESAARDSDSPTVPEASRPEGAADTGAVDPGIPAKPGTIVPNHAVPTDPESALPFPPAPALSVVPASSETDDTGEDSEPDDVRTPPATEAITLLTPLDLVEDVGEETGANVIRFRDAWDDPRAESDDMSAILRLHRVPGMEGEEEDSEGNMDGDTGTVTNAAAASGNGPSLSLMDRLEMLRVLLGARHPADTMEEPETETDEREGAAIIVSEPYGLSEVELEREAGRRYRSETDRCLEEFNRLAGDAQARAEEKATYAAELEILLAEEKEKADKTAGCLAELKTDLAAAERKIEEGKAETAKTAALFSEHRRLYKEFEELRTAYNEVVGEVMPVLQKERDDLVLTVERQCSETAELRSSLVRSRRGQTAGYSLAVAAILLLAFLPAFNWFRSERPEQQLAEAEQRISELSKEIRETRGNLDAIRGELDHSRQLAAQLDRDKKILSRQAKERGQEAANLKQGRMSAMILHGNNDENGKLRVNEVRDSSGRIRETAELNRRLRRPAASNRARVQASAVAKTTGGGNTQSPPAAASGAISTRNGGAEVATVQVKKGEGVAQVVYRVLGSRDPEIIDWVIRENRLRRDARGNPLIYPEQTLRLPRDRRSIQSANIAGAR